jgi:SnoaL-like domain
MKSTMENLSQGRIREIYEDFALCRLDRLSEAFDKDIDFLSHAPSDVFPYLGRRRGWVEVSKAISQIHEHLEVIYFWPLSILLDRNNAALTVFVSIKKRSNGNQANFLAAHFFKFRNGRVVEFCGIIDSLETVRQLEQRMVEEK